MARTVLDFAVASTRFGKELNNAHRKAVRTVAGEVAKDIQSSMRSRRWPSEQRWFGLRFFFHGNGNSAVFYARNGFVHMFEFGADGSRPSGSGAKRGRSLRGRRGTRLGSPGWWVQSRKPGGVVATPFGPRPFVRHPGFKGRPFWQAGVTRAAPRAPQVFEKALVDTIRKAVL